MTLFLPKSVLLGSVLFGFIACQGAVSTTEEPVPAELPVVEVAVTTPPVPKEIVTLPSFNAAFPDAALADLTADFATAEDPDWDSALEMRGYKGHIKLVSQLVRATKARLHAAAEFNKIAATTLSQVGFDPKSVEPVSATLAQGRLFDLDGEWLVHGEKEPVAGAALRFYYDNQEETVASFLASGLRDGIAQKGILAFVNPQLLEKTTEVGQRAFLVAYDVSHPDRTLFVVREEKAMFEHPSVLSELHAQCDTVAGECLAEVIRADGTPGSLAVTGSLRMSWSQTTQKICLQKSKPGETVFEAGKDLAGQACEMLEPAWGSQPLSDEDLVLGYFDTEPPGGDVALIMLDGQTRDGWLSLSENLIDGWLSGMSL